MADSDSDVSYPAEEEKQKKLALAALEKRREQNSSKVIDNSSLQAGSNMYYYCKYCLALTHTLSEGDFRTKPKRCCNDCQPLKDKGWLGLVP